MQRRVFLRGLLPATQCGSTVRGFAATKSAPKAPDKEAKTPRAVSGYALFLKEVSGKLKRAGLPVAEISRQAAKEWAEVSADKRQTFINEAKRLNANTPPKQTKAAPAPPAKKKPPINVYSHFCKTVYQTVVREHPGATFVERSRIIGKMWNGLSTEEKAKRKQELMMAAGRKSEK